jgi:hypothetical protein
VVDDARKKKMPTKSLFFCVKQSTMTMLTRTVKKVALSTCLVGLLLIAVATTGVEGFASSLNGLKVTSVQSGDQVDVGEYLKPAGGESSGRTLFIFGTYAADFNAIEYAQRLRYYLPQLEQECKVSKFGLLLSCQPDAAKSLAEMVDLPLDQVDIFVDNTGQVAKEWGVERGWLPDNEDVSPFLKLFGMLWGLGAWATLPAVISGYLGNPLGGQPWIEDALAVGQKQGRWPDSALEIASDGTITNKFTELPVVGEWPRRPLELATLRLQSMMGISLAKWRELAPDKQALEAGVLTQLGGCIVVDSVSGETLFKWRDPGICAVANFEDIVKKLKA